jgi:hypothetical protein
MIRRLPSLVTVTLDGVSRPSSTANSFGMVITHDFWPASHVAAILLLDTLWFFSIHPKVKDIYNRGRRGLCVNFVATHEHFKIGKGKLSYLHTKMKQE